MFVVRANKMYRHWKEIGVHRTRCSILRFAKQLSVLKQLLPVPSNGLLTEAVEKSEINHQLLRKSQCVGGEGTTHLVLVSVLSALDYGFDSPKSPCSF